ncbi:AfsR/SARP family transcriptional regulator [Glycomyces tritici]|uniref:BTAD domain-containing putative transcriptional regulator n=1 Tax=Glycomyces tritici TaxID=2665176 RepID=A0ABT7YQ43_9ACTN|nr:BTAD domain-containing putative transcriptional regulator [Glycomyces tritici]MDN3240722.1 BTAD domain-containing putative transcriptional regulator [Glycomyces tritici]
MRFGVLGPLLVEAAGGDPVTVPEAKVRALLAALLTDPGRTVSVDRLVDLLWSGEPPADPSGAIQTRVSRLRKALAAAGGTGLVVFRAGGYALEAGPDAVDASRFTALTAEARRATDARARRAHLAAALDLWRGDPFAEFADDLFFQPAAVRLAEQRLTALEDLAQTRLDLGEHAALAAELGELVAEHPRRERLRSVHMRALYLAGRQSEALDSYHALRRHLGDELGLDPAPELVELYGEILRQTPATRFTDSPDTVDEERRGNVPRALVDLIGRDECLGDVRDSMRAHRLTTLTGTGGVGKTSLALAAVGEPSADHPDGTWLVELAGQAETATPAQIADAVARVLRLRDEQAAPVGDEVAWLAEAMRPKRIRLVIDNCEHVAAAAAAVVDALLRGVPGLTVLATSQEPLGVPGERLIAVPPLDDAGAAALFRARAENAAPGLTLTAEDAAVIAEICRHLDGIPLALELAANRIRVLGLRELAQRLDDRFGLLTGGRREAPARQQTLRAMLDWSWDLLTASERIVLRCLAVHADGCTLPAAEATCAAPGVEPRAVLDLLARLVDRSLVTVVYGDQGPRYRLLESVSVYCAERRRELGDDVAAKAAHAAYYVALAEEADAALRGPDQLRWRCVLDAEDANLRAALDFAASGPVARGDVGSGGAPAANGANAPRVSAGQAAASEAAADPFASTAAGGVTADGVVLGGLMPNRIPVVASPLGGQATASGGDPNRTAAEALAAAPGPELELRLVNALSWHWYLRGRLTEPKRRIAGALRRVAESEPTVLCAEAAVTGTALRLLSGDTAVLTESVRAELETHLEAIADPSRRVRSRWFLALTFTTYGDPATAEHFAAAVDAALDDTDDWGRAAADFTGAYLRFNRGDLTAARDRAEQSLDRFREVGDHWGQAQAEALLGRLAEARGDYPAAAAHHRRGLDAAEAFDLQAMATAALSELGRIALLEGDFDRADEHHGRAQRRAIEHADVPAQEFAEVGLALSARRRGDLDLAEALLRRWYDWNSRLDTELGLTFIAAELGFTAELRGDADAAVKRHTESLESGQRTGNPRAVALALEGLAGAHALAGRHEHAARLLGQATAARAALGAPLPAAERGDVDRIEQRLRTALGDEEFARVSTVEEPDLFAADLTEPR